MTLRTLRYFVRRLVRSAHVACLIVMTAVSPVAWSLEITLGTAMKIRDAQSSTLKAVGVLAAGSVVEIPDQYKVMSKGKVDADATFNRWLISSGYNSSDVDRKISNPHRDFFYPVRIISLAKGSNAPGLVGETRYMALRVLERSHGSLRVNESSRVYQGSPTAVPLHALKDDRRTLPSARLLTQHKGLSAKPPVVRAARPVAPRPPVAPQKVSPMAQQKVSPMAQQKVSPMAQQKVSPMAQSASSSELAATTSAACLDCSVAASAPSSAPADFATDLLPQAYDDEARGMQSLNDKRFNARCSEFIKADGSYGPWGQQVLKEIMSSDSGGRGTSDFLTNWDMSNANAQAACPRFNSFSPQQKRHFWVYTIAAVAQQEASCNPNAIAPTSMNANGHADGLMQIEEIASLRETRDVVYGGQYCAGGNPTEINSNLRCGVRMLDDVVNLHHGPFELRTKIGVFDNYYSSLRKPDTLARRLISQYKDCGAHEFSKRKAGRYTHRRTK